MDFSGECTSAFVIALTLEEHGLSVPGTFSELNYPRRQLIHLFQNNTGELCVLVSHCVKPSTCCSVSVPSRINKSHCRRKIKSRESQFHHHELNEGSNYKDSLYGNLCTIVIKWFRFQFRFRNFCGRSCQRFCNYDFPYRVSDEIPRKIKSLKPT